MNDDEFIALCLDPATTVNTIVRHVEPGHGREDLAISHIVDDETCAAVLRRIYPQRSINIGYEAFKRRPMAFYTTYRDELFTDDSWTRRCGVLYVILRSSAWNIDLANKVAYILPRCDRCRFDGCVTMAIVVAIGLNHPDTGVRCQFPAVAPAVAVFLVGVPPRVKCRVLESLRAGNTQ